MANRLKKADKKFAAAELALGEAVRAEEAARTRTLECKKQLREAHRIREAARTAEWELAGAQARAGCAPEARRVAQVPGGPVLLARREQLAQELAE
eukprot:8189998-Lingulodinium_polyedra.AAC.1